MKLPDKLEIEVIQEDILEANKPGDICSTCPTANALKRHYPGIDWTVDLGHANCKKLRFALSKDLMEQVYRFTAFKTFELGKYTLTKHKPQ